MGQFRAQGWVLGAAFSALASAAMAGPVTFAQMSEGNSGDGIVWTNNGNGTATFNTATAGGDPVQFSFSNIAGLAGALTGSLSAIETINGGAGVTTSALATSAAGFDFQPINAPLTISYALATPIGGQTNLLTITITPNTQGALGMVFSGQNGGSGASSSTSQPTSPSSSYTMTFSSAFLEFAANASINASFSYSSLDPEMLIGADGLLNSFSAEDTATFSANPTPLFVGEPASRSVLAVGLVGLCAMRRRRHVSAAWPPFQKCKLNLLFTLISQTECALSFWEHSWLLLLSTKRRPHRIRWQMPPNPSSSKWGARIYSR